MEPRVVLDAMTMVSMFSFSVPLDKKDTIHTAQQVSSVALFVHGCDIAGNLAAPGHRAVNACSAPLSALAAAKNSRVHGSCTCSATLTAPRAVAMPTAPAVPVAPKMHAAPCLEPRSVAAPTSSLSTKTCWWGVVNPLSTRGWSPPLSTRLQYNQCPKFCLFVLGALP